MVCCFGNAAGEDFTSSIYPFILRAVSLDDICHTIGFAELPDYCARAIAGGIRGRAVTRF